jgi:hypothetical protein
MAGQGRSEVRRCWAARGKMDPSCCWGSTMALGTRWYSRRYHGKYTSTVLLRLHNKETGAAVGADDWKSTTRVLCGCGSVVVDVYWVEVVRRPFTADAVQDGGAGERP